MSPDERQKLILKYVAGYQEVIDSLAGFPEASLPAHPFQIGRASCRERV